MNRINASGWVKIIGALSAAICAVIGSLALAGAFDNDTAPAPSVAEQVHQIKDAVPSATVVDGPDQDAKKDDVIPVGPAAQEVVAELAVNEADLAGDLVGDEPVGPVAKLQAPFAAEEIPGCRTAFLRTNWSYRTVPQSLVIWFVPHYTAGRDIPGSRADVDGLTAYGNNPASRVSWNINMDKDGNCDYNVPLRYKSWAFGNANSRAINMEVHGSGEAPYLRDGGYRQLARIWKYVHEAYPQIKLRLGSVSNCGPGSAGIVTHWMGGACSGGHTDIRPLDIVEVIARLRREVRALDCGSRCKALKARHAAAHKRYQARGCRGRAHKVKASSLRRPECRRVKRTIHEQHRKLRVRYGI